MEIDERLQEAAKKYSDRAVEWVKALGESINRGRKVINAPRREFAQAFVAGAEWQRSQVWHKGDERPCLAELPQGDGTLFFVVVRRDALFDYDQFFCFYDEGESQPWGVMALPGTSYPVRIAPQEVDRWAVVDEIVGRDRRWEGSL